MYDVNRHNEAVYDIHRHNEAVYDIHRHKEVVYDIHRHKEVVYDIHRHKEVVYDANRHKEAVYDMCFAIKRLYIVPHVQFGGTCSCFQHLQWFQSIIHPCYTKDVRMSIRRVYIKDRYLVSSTEYEKQIQHITF